MTSEQRRAGDGPKAADGSASGAGGGSGGEVLPVVLDAGIKPGVRSTEFWATIVAQLAAIAVLVGLVPGCDDPAVREAALHVLLGSTGIYAVSRSWAKRSASAAIESLAAGEPDVAPPASRVPPPSPSAVLLALGLSVLVLGLLGGCADGNRADLSPGASVITGGPTGMPAYRYDADSYAGTTPVPQGISESGPDGMTVSMPAPYTSFLIDFSAGQMQFASGKDYEIGEFNAEVNPDSGATTISFAALTVSATNVVNSYAAIVAAESARIVALGEQQRDIEIQRLKTQAAMGDVLAASVLSAVTRILSGGVAP